MKPRASHDIRPSVARILASLSLDSFLSLNPSPSIRKYPNIETFKNGFVALNERLYKEAKKGPEPSKLRRAHLAVLEDRPIGHRLKHKLGRSAMKYVHSHCIIKLLHGFFSLFEYHHPVRRVFPEVFEAFFRVIFTVFASLEKGKMHEMLKEVCSGGRMLEFYQEMYRSWEEEIGNVEKEVLLQRRA